MTDGTMTGIDYFAWLVLIVIAVTVIAGFIALARLPGQIAQKRDHPQAEAINAAGWLGLLLTLGVVWALALIWAMLKPGFQFNRNDAPGDDIEALKSRIAELEAQLDAAREV
jgi:amino acid transporter